MMEEPWFLPDDDLSPQPVRLDDARDFYAFNEVFRHYFGEHPPARACAESRMLVDCKVEVDCVACKRQAG